MPKPQKSSNKPKRRRKGMKSLLSQRKGGVSSIKKDRMRKRLSVKERKAARQVAGGEVTQTIMARREELIQRFSVPPPFRGKDRAANGRFAKIVAKEKKNDDPEVPRAGEENEEEANDDVEAVPITPKKRGRPPKNRPVKSESSDEEDLPTSSTIASRKSTRPHKQRVIEKDEITSEGEGPSSRIVVKEKKKEKESSDAVVPTGGEDNEEEDRADQSANDEKKTVPSTPKTAKRSRPPKIRVVDSGSSDEEDLPTSSTIASRKSTRTRRQRVIEEDEITSEGEGPSSRIVVKEKKKEKESSDAVVPTGGEEDEEEDRADKSAKDDMAKKTPKRGRPPKIRVVDSGSSDEEDLPTSSTITSRKSTRPRRQRVIEDDEITSEGEGPSSRIVVKEKKKEKESSDAVVPTGGEDNEEKDRADQSANDEKKTVPSTPKTAKRGRPPKIRVVDSGSSDEEDLPTSSTIASRKSTRTRRQRVIEKDEITSEGEGPSSRIVDKEKKKEKESSDAVVPTGGEDNEEEDRADKSTKDDMAKKTPKRGRPPKVRLPDSGSSDEEDLPTSSTITSRKSTRTRRQRVIEDDEITSEGEGPSTRIVDKKKKKEGEPSADSAAEVPRGGEEYEEDRAASRRATIPSLRTTEDEESDYEPVDHRSPTTLDATFKALKDEVAATALDIVQPLKMALEKKLGKRGARNLYGPLYDAEVLARRQQRYGLIQAQDTLVRDFRDRRLIGPPILVLTCRGGPMRDRAPDLRGLSSLNALFPGVKRFIHARKDKKPFLGIKCPCQSSPRGLEEHKGNPSHGGLEHGRLLLAKAFAATGIVQDEEGDLPLHTEEIEPRHVWLCTEECCRDVCSQHIGQIKRTIKLVLFDDLDKAWSLVTAENAVTGTILVVGAGEILREDDREQVEDEFDKNYNIQLPVLDIVHGKVAEQTGFSLYVRQRSSELRFVAHSCAPNSRLLFVHVDRTGVPVPVLVARREILAGEEITMDWGDDLSFACRAHEAWGRCRDKSRLHEKSQAKPQPIKDDDVDKAEDTEAIPTTPKTSKLGRPPKIRLPDGGSSDAEELPSSSTTASRKNKKQPKDNEPIKDNVGNSEEAVPTTPKTPKLGRPRKIRKVDSESSDAEELPSSSTFASRKSTRTQRQRAMEEEEITSEGEGPSRIARQKRHQAVEEDEITSEGEGPSTRIPERKKRQRVPSPSPRRSDSHGKKQKEQRCSRKEVHYMESGNETGAESMASRRNGESESSDSADPSFSIASKKGTRPPRRQRAIEDGEILSEGEGPSSRIVARQMKPRSSNPSPRRSDSKDQDKKKKDNRRTRKVVKYNEEESGNETEAVSRSARRITKNAKATKRSTSSVDGRKSRRAASEEPAPSAPSGQRERKKREIFSPGLPSAPKEPFSFGEKQKDDEREYLSSLNIAATGSATLTLPLVKKEVVVVDSDGNEELGSEREEQPSASLPGRSASAREIAGSSAKRLPPRQAWIDANRSLREELNSDPEEGSVVSETRRTKRQIRPPKRFRSASASDFSEGEGPSRPMKKPQKEAKVEKKDKVDGVKYHPKYDSAPRDVQTVYEVPIPKETLQAAHKQLYPPPVSEEDYRRRSDRLNVVEPETFDDATVRLAREMWETERRRVLSGMSTHPMMGFEEGTVRTFDQKLDRSWALKVMTDKVLAENTAEYYPGLFPNNSYTKTASFKKKQKVVRKAEVKMNLHERAGAVFLDATPSAPYPPILKKVMRKYKKTRSFKTWERTSLQKMPAHAKDLKSLRCAEEGDLCCSAGCSAWEGVLALGSRGKGRVVPNVADGIGGKILYSKPQETKDEEGRFKMLTSKELDDHVVALCNRGCHGGRRCPQSSAAIRRTSVLILWRDHKKGWSLYNLYEVEAGTVLVSPTGIAITSAEYAAMDQSTANHWVWGLIGRYIYTGGSMKMKGEGEGTYYIDCTDKSNIAKFANHSCAPSMVMWDVMVQRTGAARIVYTSRAALAPGTELTYDYTVGQKAVSLPFLHKCGKYCRNGPGEEEEEHSADDGEKEEATEEEMAKPVVDDSDSSDEDGMDADISSSDDDDWDATEAHDIAHFKDKKARKGGRY